MLKPEKYTLSTLEDTLTQPSNAKVFTNIEESSYLTTFITVHGRFRWIRLPFGLSVSSDIFPKRLHKAIDRLSVSSVLLMIL